LSAGLSPDPLVNLRPHNWTEKGERGRVLKKGEDWGEERRGDKKGEEGMATL